MHRDDTDACDCAERENIVNSRLYIYNNKLFTNFVMTRFAEDKLMKRKTLSALCCKKVQSQTKRDL